MASCVDKAIKSTWLTAGKLQKLPDMQSMHTKQIYNAAFKTLCFLSFKSVSEVSYLHIISSLYLQMTLKGPICLSFSSILENGTYLSSYRAILLTISTNGKTTLTMYKIHKISCRWATVHPGLSVRTLVNVVVNITGLSTNDRHGTLVIFFSNTLHNNFKYEVIWCAMTKTDLGVSDLHHPIWNCGD